MIELHGNEMEILISALGGEPGKRGRTRCFLHGGNNPTTFSYTEDGLWYCFAEGKGGDAVDLVMEAKGYSREEALKFLADLGIIEAQLALRNKREKRKLEHQLRKKEMLRETTLKYALCLWKAVEKAAQKYLNQMDFDLYMEVSRRFEALKKRCFNPSPETAQTLLKMRGAAREFFSKLPLDDQDKLTIRFLFTMPSVYKLIYQLNHTSTKTVFHHTKDQPKSQVSTSTTLS